MTTYHHNLLKNQGLGPVFASLQEDQMSLEANRSYSAQFKRSTETEIHRKAPATLEKNDKREMLIHLIALEHSTESLNDILHFGHISDINASIKVGSEIITPMHYAVQSGSLEKVNFLVNKGASVSVKKLKNYALTTEMKNHLASAAFQDMVNEKKETSLQIIQEAKEKKCMARTGNSSSNQLKSSTQRAITHYTQANIINHTPIATPVLTARKPRQVSMDRFIAPPTAQLQATERTAEQLRRDAGKRDFEIAVRRSLEDLHALDNSPSQSSNGTSSSSSTPRSRASSLSSEGHTDIENITPNSQNTSSPVRKKKTSSENHTPKFVKSTTKKQSMAKSITSFFPSSVGSLRSNESITAGVMTGSLFDSTPSAPPAISSGTFEASIVRDFSSNRQLADNRLPVTPFARLTAPSIPRNRSFGTNITSNLIRRTSTNGQSLVDRLYDLESQHPTPTNPRTPRASLMTARDRLTLDENAETIGWVARHNNRSTSSEQNKSHQK